MPNLLSRVMSVVGLALFGAALATPASAVTVVGASVINTYSFTFDNAGVPSTGGGERSTILQSDQRPIPSSQLGVDFVGQADVNSFFFLHNDYCVGRCQIASSTTIRFELINFGDFLDNVRFDSLITPGHLALVGLGSYENTAASFGFTVSRTNTFPGEGEGGVGEPVALYNANGYADIYGLRVEANGIMDPFTNTRQGDNGGAGLYYDWSATSLNVDLGAIGSFERIYVDYTATYTVQSFNTCDDILNCNAAQVVFGDPRNLGGGTNLTSGKLARAFLNVDPTIDGGVHAVITREYDSFNVPFAFVDNGQSGVSSLPMPTAEAPITYIGNYIPNAVDTGSISAVPEPTTWVSMVFGFAATGGLLRRRRAAPKTMVA